MPSAEWWIVRGAIRDLQQLEDLIGNTIAPSTQMGALLVVVYRNIVSTKAALTAAAERSATHGGCKGNVHVQPSQN